MACLRHCLVQKLEFRVEKSIFKIISTDPARLFWAYVLRDGFSFIASLVMVAYTLIQMIKGKHKDVTDDIETQTADTVGNEDAEVTETVKPRPNYADIVKRRPQTMASLRVISRSKHLSTYLDRVP